MLKDPINKKVEKSIFSFQNWLEHYGELSYDQFDFWGSKIGVKGKSIFLKNKLLGAPIVISLQVLESFFPSARCIFAKKKRN